MPFSAHCDIDLDLSPSFYNIPVRSISASIRGRYPKFGVCIHLGMTRCRITFSDHFDLDL